MNAANIINNFFQMEKGMQNHTTSFRTGQIIHAKIVKLFPNNLAEIQIGSQKVIAQLDTALSANGRYWFQVVSGEGQVHLKVMKQQKGRPNYQKGTIEQLLQQFSLTANKENIEMIRFFLNKQVPITKEIIVKSAEWLHDRKSFQHGLEVINQIITRNLPFTKDVFLALSTSLKGESLHSLMTNLQALLKSNEEHNGTTINLINVIDNLTSTTKEKVKGQLVTNLLEGWLNAESEPQSSKVAFQLLQKLGFISVAHNEETMLKQVMVKIMSEQENELLVPDGNFIREVLIHYKNNNKTEMMNVLTTFLSEMDKSLTPSYINEVRNLLEQLKIMNKDIPILEKNVAGLVTEWLSSIFQSDQILFSNSEKVISLFPISHEIVEDVIDSIYQNGGNVPLKFMQKLTIQEKELITNLLMQSHVVDWENGNSIKEYMKEIIQLLGLSYEFEGTESRQNMEGYDPKQLHNLRSLLINYLNENPPYSIKDSSEQLLQKIIGFQVLSQEVGPIQQLVVQLPISLWNKTVDLTVQWSGRKRVNGEIDSSYCRILFYLNLENLNETIVDMQVQNRVMSITVFNERGDELKTAASLFMETLRENLSKLNYKLSAVQFVKNTTQEEKNINKSVFKMIESKNYSGLDIKI